MGHELDDHPSPALFRRLLGLFRLLGWFRRGRGELLGGLHRRFLLHRLLLYWRLLRGRLDHLGEPSQVND